MKANRIVGFTTKFELGIFQYWVAPNFIVPQVKIFIHLRFSIRDYKSVMSVLNSLHAMHHITAMELVHGTAGRALHFFNANTIISQLTTWPPAQMNQEI
jgi:hypothetical protein